MTRLKNVQFTVKAYIQTFSWIFEAVWLKLLGDKRSLDDIINNTLIPDSYGDFFLDMIKEVSETLEALEKEKKENST